MRKILTLATIALLFAACGKEADNNGNTQIEDAGTIVNFLSSGVSTTRTSFDGIIDISWATGDQIEVVQSTDNSSFAQKVYTANAQGQTDGSALFTPSDGQPFVIPTGSTATYYYWAYYPYKGGAVNSSAGTVAVELPGTQTQAGRTTDHLSGYNILCASRALDAPDNNDSDYEVLPGNLYLDLDFSIATALMEFRFATEQGNVDWADAQIQSVTLHSINDLKPLAGQGTMVINQPSTAANFAAITTTSGTDEITISISGTANTIPAFSSWPASGAVADGSVFPVYMTVLPAQSFNVSTDYFVLTVRTDKGTFVKQHILPPANGADYDIVRGRKYVMNVLLNGTPS